MRSLAEHRVDYGASMFVFTGDVAVEMSEVLSSSENRSEERAECTAGKREECGFDVALSTPPPCDVEIAEDVSPVRVDAARTGPLGFVVDGPDELDTAGTHGVPVRSNTGRRRAFDDESSTSASTREGENIPTRAGSTNRSHGKHDTEGSTPGGSRLGTPRRRRSGKIGSFGSRASNGISRKASRQLSRQGTAQKHQQQQQPAEDEAPRDVNGYRMPVLTAQMLEAMPEMSIPGVQVRPPKRAQTENSLEDLSQVQSASPATVPRENQPSQPTTSHGHEHPGKARLIVDSNSPNRSGGSPRPSNGMLPLLGGLRGKQLVKRNTEMNRATDSVDARIQKWEEVMWDGRSPHEDRAVGLPSKSASQNYAYGLASSSQSNSGTQETRSSAGLSSTIEPGAANDSLSGVVCTVTPSSTTSQQLEPPRESAASAKTAAFADSHGGQQASVVRSESKKSLAFEDQVRVISIMPKYRSTLIRFPAPIEEYKPLSTDTENAGRAQALVAAEQWSSALRVRGDSQSTAARWSEVDREMLRDFGLLPSTSAKSLLVDSLQAAGAELSGSIEAPDHEDEFGRIQRELLEEFDDDEEDEDVEAFRIPQEDHWRVEVPAQKHLDVDDIPELDEDLEYPLTFKPGASRSSGHIAPEKSSLSAGGDHDSTPARVVDFGDEVLLNMFADLLKT